MRRPVRALTIAVVVIAIACGIAFAALEISRAMPMPSDAYASDWTAIFVIEHLKSSNNVWPMGWEDLRDEFDRMAEPSHYAWTFKELQDRVNLRFDVTADQVRDAKSAIEVFSLTSGHKASYDGDPNQLIRHYLHTGEGGMQSIRRTP